jgi:hypothetical protein
MSDTSSPATTCINCGDELPAERVELGYRYCTKAPCQARHHRGLTVTTVGVNKSADAVIVADPDEVRRRGEVGEFAKKDTGIGLDYRSPTGVPTGRRPRAAPPGPTQPSRAQPAPRRPWTPEQEKIVRLYHDMGLSPRQIVARARENAPRLQLTEPLVVRIMSALPRRRGRPPGGR